MNGIARKALSLVLASVLLVSMCLFCSGCGETILETAPETEMVEKALELITAEWKEAYQEHGDYMGKEIKIAYTQVYYIEPTSQGLDEEQKALYDQYCADIEAIVSFTIMADCYGVGEGYLSTAHAYPNDVIFYKDGRTEVAARYLQMVGNRNYDYNCDPYIEKFVDVGETYNCTIRLDQ